LTIEVLSTYRPTWLATGAGDGRSGGRACGHDEDALTLAVAAVRPVLEQGHRVRRVVLVTREPATLQGDTAEVLTTALGLDGVPVEEHLGGGPAVLDLLAGAAPGTAVVAVHVSAPAGAAAALIGDEGGTPVTAAGAVSHSLPLVVDRPHGAAARTYDDPRLLRERGWKPALEALSGEAGPTLVVGAPARLAPSPPVDPSLSAVPVAGAPAALFAAAALQDAGRAGRVVAVEGASGRAVELGPPSAVLVRAERAERPPAPTTTDDSVELPISLAAYERAFRARVGFRAARCPCGHLEYPPAHRCPACGREDPGDEVPLPRRGSVYSVVTVRTRVPGLTTPYSLAIVELDGTDVRVLVHVTGVEPGAVAIGDTGELVLRRVALRQGVGDYAYAFEPLEVAG
jgi:uncharacterized OB-fold protein